MVIIDMRPKRNLDLLKMMHIVMEKTENFLI